MSTPEGSPVLDSQISHFVQSMQDLFVLTSSFTRNPSFFVLTPTILPVKVSHSPRYRQFTLISVSLIMNDTEISVNCRYLGEWETLTGKIVGVKTKNDGFLVKLDVNTNKSCIDWTKCDIWLSKTGEPSGVLISDPD